jgi:hypothetical protein
MRTLKQKAKYQRDYRERIKLEDPERNEEIMQHNRIYQKEYTQRPEVKERRKKYLQRPEVKKRIKEYLQRPEVKERRKKYSKVYQKKQYDEMKNFIGSIPMEVVMEKLNKKSKEFLKVPLSKDLIEKVREKLNHNEDCSKNRIKFEKVIKRLQKEDSNLPISGS